MKKIQWLTDACFIDVDLPIVPELSKYYNITWYIVLHKKDQIDYKALIKKQCNNIKNNIEFIYIQNRISNPLILNEYMKIIRKTQTKDADIIYYNITGIPYLFSAFYPFINKKKTIIALHNVTTPKGASLYHLAKAYTWFTRKVFSNFHVFSQNQFNLLNQITYNKNILYAPLALKDFGESNTLKASLVTFLFFGYIREYKRVDILIKAAQRAYEQTHKLFKVSIAGSCNNWSAYQALIQYPQLFDLNIRSISNEEIPNIFGSAHYFVMPYQSIAQSGAMAVSLHYNLPIIASDLPTFREFIEDGENGYFMKRNDVESLSQIMINVLEEGTATYQEMCQKQKEFVNKKLSLESIIQKYQNYFDNL